MKRSPVLYLVWPLLLLRLGSGQAAATTAAQSDSDGQPVVEPPVRAAIVRVEAAVDPFSPGPELMAELALHPAGGQGSRQRPSGCEAELDRRLRLGSVGTGFLVNRRGDVVTTAHVVLSGVRYQGLHFTQAQWDSMALVLRAIRDIWVTVGEGEEVRTYLAAPVVVSEELDLAVLRVCRPERGDHEFVPLPIAPSDDLQVGQPILAVGFPEDEFQSRSGKILSLIHGGRVHEEMQVIRGRDPDTGQETITLSGTSPGPLVRFQHSAACGHGSSGGPLLDQHGRVIGVAYAQVLPPRSSDSIASGDRAQGNPEGNQEPGPDALSLAIASNVLRRFLTEHAIPFNEAGR